ncbi:MAG TPA: hypothetical protein VKZ18_18355, partial [Polyangia bacterium]|nr:hypothetical protein [Polyangia bacterium]
MTAPSSVDGSPGGAVQSRAVAVAKSLLDAAVTPVRGALNYAGERALLLAAAIGGLFRRPFRLRLFLEQMEFVGVGSLPIICFV